MAKDRYISERKYAERYKKGEIQQPTDKSSKNSDNKDYYFRWAEFIMSQYISGFCQFGVGGRITSNTGYSFEELRRYGLGTQDNNRYKDLLDKCDPNKNEGYININWQNVMIMPKFRDIVKGKMESSEFEFGTKIIDGTATHERMLEAAKMKVALNPRMQELYALTGGMPQAKAPEGINTPEDVETLLKLGGIPLAYELFLNDAMEYSREDSSWDELKQRWRDDVIDINVVAGKVYLEKATNTVKIRYVDPAQLVVRATKSPGHDDIDYAGEMRRMTISQLRMEAGLSEDEILNIVKMYNGAAGNGYYGGSIYDGYQSSMYQRSAGAGDNYYNAPYDNLQVDVLDFCFIGNEVEKYVMGFRSDGTEIFDQVKSSSKLTPKDEKKGKRFYQNEVQYVYCCKWVVGTKYVFDCGKEYGIVRYNQKGIKDTRLPYIIYSDRTPSIVERCIPHIDDIQLAVLKKRNTLAKMAPGPRIILDKSLLRSTVDIGGKSYNMMELIELFPKTGVLVIESQGEYEDTEMKGSNRKPIDYVTTGITEDIGILANEVAAGIDLIRGVTGLNEVADGSVQNADMLVGVVENLGAASNNALKPTMRTYLMLQLNAMKYVVNKWQVSLIQGDVSFEYLPINSNVTKMVQYSGGVYSRDLGIYVVPMPSETDRQLLLQDILSKRQMMNITEADYVVLYNMIKMGEFKKAQLYMVKAVEQEQKRKQMEAMQNLQAQSQAQAQAALAVEQEKQKSLQLEYQLKMQLAIVEEEAKRKTIAMQMQMQGVNNKENMQQGLENDLALKTMDNIMQGQNPSV